MPIDRQSVSHCSGLHFVCVLASFRLWSLHYFFRWVLKNSTIAFISYLPKILHLGEDFSNLRRTQYSTCRLVSGCTCVAAYIPCPRDQDIRISSKRAPLSSSNWKDMEKLLTMCKFYSQNYLIGISAGFSFVWIFSNSISLSLKISQTKWNLMSICFVLAWYTWFFAK